MDRKDGEPAAPVSATRRGAFDLSFDKGEFSIGGKALLISEAAVACSHEGHDHDHEGDEHLGTGTAVWECAVVLAKFIEFATGAKSTRPDLDVDNCIFASGHWKGKRVLELGSGTGLLGISLATMGALTMCTDLPELLPLLRSNVELNRELIAKCGGSVTATALDWTDPAKFLESQTTGFDYIVCSDLVFNASAILPLTRVLFALCSIRTAKSDSGDVKVGKSDASSATTPTVVLFAHKSRTEAVDEALFSSIMRIFDGEEIPIDRQHPDYCSRRIDLYRMSLKPNAKLDTDETSSIDKAESSSSTMSAELS